MSGVEILNTEVITTQTGGFNVAAFSVTIIVCAVIGLFIGLIVSNDDYTPILGLLLGVFIGLVFGAFTGAAFQRPIIQEEKVVHKVIVSDEVSLNEFYEKYEILDKEGKIYTITERKE